MPIPLAPIILLGLGLVVAGRKKEKLKKEKVGTTGDFLIRFTFPEDKSDEFIRDLRKVLHYGKIQASAPALDKVITLDVAEQASKPGAFYAMGTFSSPQPISSELAYSIISDKLALLTQGFSIMPQGQIALTNIKNKMGIPWWDVKYVESCNQKLEALAGQPMELGTLSDEIALKLKSIADANGNVIDYDIAEATLQSLNKRIPGCNLRDLRQEEGYGLIIDRKGMASMRAYRTFYILAEYAFQWMEDNDIPYGFEYQLPSLIPDFVKLKMDQFRPITEIA